MIFSSYAYFFIQNIINNSLIDQKVKEYAVINHTTKSRVMINALAYYLGCVDDVLLNRKVMELEKRLPRDGNVKQKLLL